MERTGGMWYAHVKHFEQWPTAFSVTGPDYPLYAQSIRGIQVQIHQKTGEKNYVDDDESVIMK